MCAYRLSPEFDRFLSERADGGATTQQRNNNNGRQMQKDDQDNALFSL